MKMLSEKNALYGYNFNRIYGCINFSLQMVSANHLFRTSTKAKLLELLKE